MRDVIKDYWGYFYDKRDRLRKIIEYVIKLDSVFEPHNVYEFVFYHRMRRLCNQYFGMSIGKKSSVTMGFDKNNLKVSLFNYIRVGLFIFT